MNNTRGIKGTTSADICSCHQAHTIIGTELGNSAYFKQQLRRNRILPQQQRFPYIHTFIGIQTSFNNTTPPVQHVLYICSSG